MRAPNVIGDRLPVLVSFHATTKAVRIKSVVRIGQTIRVDDLHRSCERPARPFLPAQYAKALARRDELTRDQSHDARERQLPLGVAAEGRVLGIPSPLRLDLSTELARRVLVDPQCQRIRLGVQPEGAADQHVDLLVDPARHPALVPLQIANPRNGGVSRIQPGGVGRQQ